jgi:hypothetical protein
MPSQPSTGAHPMSSSSPQSPTAGALCAEDCSNVASHPLLAAPFGATSVRGVHAIANPEPVVPQPDLTHASRSASPGPK